MNKAKTVLFASILAVLALASALLFIDQESPSNEATPSSAADPAIPETEESVSSTATMKESKSDPSEKSLSETVSARQSVTAKIEDSITGTLSLPHGRKLPDTLKVEARVEKGAAKGELFQSQTKADGSFTIGLPAGVEKIRLSLDEDYYGGTKTVRRDKEEQWPRTELPVHIGGKIEGTIYLPGGKLGEGSRVELTRVFDVAGQFQGGADRIYETQDTQGTNTYAFKVVSPGTGTYVRAKKDGFAPALQKDIEVKEFQTIRVDLHFSPESVVSGRVVDENGKPVAQARLEVRSWGGLGSFLDKIIFTSRDLDEQREHPTFSDVNGYFRVGSLAEGKYKIRAFKEDYYSGTGKTVQLAKGEHSEKNEIQIRTGKTISGTVLDHERNPVAGAEVRGTMSMYTEANYQMQLGREDGTAETKSDAEGRFALGGLSGDPYELDVTAKDVGETKVKSVKPGTKDLEIILQPYGGISGTVRAAESGVPLTKFRIQAKTKIRMFIPKTVATEQFEADDGTFTMKGVPAGDFDFVVTAEGFAPASRKIVLREGEVSQGNDFELLPAATIRGKVFVEGTREPVSGAKIAPAGKGPMAWMSSMTDNSGAEAISNQDGTFELSGLNAGEVTLRVNHDDFAVAVDGPHKVEAGQSLEGIEIAVKEGGGVDGFVYDDEGVPVGGAFVQVIGMATGTFKFKSTDNTGYFQIPKGLGEGKYQVVCIPKLGDAETDAEMRTQIFQSVKTTFADVKEGEVTRVVLGEKKEGGVTVTGKVFSGGKPLEGAFVSLVPRVGETDGEVKFAATDKSGEYTLENVSPGYATFNVQRGAMVGSTQTFAAEIPDTDYFKKDFHLPGGGIKGKIVDGRNGSPIADLFVTLTGADQAFAGAGAEGSFGQTQTSESGEFLFQDVGKGDHVITTPGGLFAGDTSKGFGRVVRRVTVNENQVLQGVLIELLPGGSVEGKVMGIGTPIRGASVFFQNAAGQVVNSFSDVATDDSGSFLYKGLSDGAYTVIVRAPGYAPTKQGPVFVRSGETVSVEVLLNQGTEVIVLVKGKADKFISGASVKAYDKDGLLLNSLLALSEVMEMWTEGVQPGKYKLGSFEPGTYKIVVEKEGFQTQTLTVEVKRQVEQTISVSLESL